MLKVTENVLPDNLCRSLIEEYQDKPEVDRTNHHRNPSKGLIPSYAPGTHSMHTFDGPKKEFRYSSYILVNDIVGQLKKRVLMALQDKGMAFSLKAACMFYRWSNFSYYPAHADAGFAQSASIYLNENYSTNDGGMFLYKDNERWIGIEPSFNRSVYFDQTNHPEGILHMVTPVTSNRERMSIQLFEED